MTNSSHLVFVYGTLKRGGGLHRALRESEFVGSAVTLGFAMYDLGAFPGIVPHRLGSSVHGELYKVTDETLGDLDRIEGVPTLYSREIIEVYFRSERCEGVQPGVQVYVYNGAPSEENRIPAGEWPVGGGVDD